MSDRPLFSVIIPAYNAEDHIRKGLQSILNQTFTDYELIVACDSCTDRTEEIAKSYGAKVISVNYHLDGLTRNAALDIAKGDRILFMDDDDWFLHEYVFQQLSEVAGKFGEDAICFSAIYQNHGYFRQDPNNVNVPVWTKCWRREFIGDTRFSIRHYWSDCDFHNKLMRKPHKFVYWDMPMYYYNWNREGSISQLVHTNQNKHYANKPINITLKDQYYTGNNAIEVRL